MAGGSYEMCLCPSVCAMCVRVSRILTRECELSAQPDLCIVEMTDGPALDHVAVDTMDDLKFYDVKFGWNLILCKFENMTMRELGCVFNNRIYFLVLGLKLALNKAYIPSDFT